MHHLIAGLALLRLASAMPTSPNTLSIRQDDSSLYTCRENGCTDCPFYFSAGKGWPDCPYYTGDQLTKSGFPLQENGQYQIFIDVPKQDEGCRTLIRTPVRPNDQNCGGNVIIAEGETCAPITIDNTFIASFCCGIDDCTAAGAPGKRDLLSSRQSGAGIMLLHDKDGNVIEPQTAALLQVREPEPEPEPKPVPAQTLSDAAAFARSLTKRDCDGFTATKGPYQTGGTNHIISDVVTCTATESCDAEIGEEVTEETTFSTSVSVGDPLGIVSASVGFEFSQSVSQSFSGKWTFGPGEKGYVVFIPYITCVEGYFTGDCGDKDKQTTICGGEGSDKQIKGERRGVVIRG